MNYKATTNKKLLPIGAQEIKAKTLSDDIKDIAQFEGCSRAKAWVYNGEIIFRHLSGFGYVHITVD